MHQNMHLGAYFLNLFTNDFIFFFSLIRKQREEENEGKEEEKHRIVQSTLRVQD